MVGKLTVNPEDMRFCSERDLPNSRDGVYLFCNYVTQHEQRLFDGFVALLAGDIDESVRLRLLDFMQRQGDGDGLRIRLVKALEELVEERRSYKKRKKELDTSKTRLEQSPQDDATRDEMNQLLRERDKMLELIKEIDGRDPRALNAALYGFQLVVR